MWWLLNYFFYIIVSIFVLFIILILIFEIISKRTTDKCTLIDPENEDDSKPYLLPSEPKFQIYLLYYIFKQIFMGGESQGMASIKSSRKNYEKNGVKMSQATFLGNHIISLWGYDEIIEALVKKSDVICKFSPDTVPSFKRFFTQSVVAVEGDQWVKQRKIMNPSFHFDHIRNLVPTFTKLNEKLFDLWENKNYSSGTPFEYMDHMTNLTLDAIGLGGFGFDFKAIEGKSASEYNDYETVIKEFLNPLRTIKYYDSMNSKLNINYNAAIDRFNKFLEDIIIEKKKNIENNNDDNSEKDLLDLMILSSNNEGDDDNLSFEELIHNLWIFFLAGHETTATSLGFILYLLAKHQDEQEKLYQEIIEVTEGNSPDYDHFKEMPYLTQVIKEAMRLYPPAFGISRSVNEDTSLGGYFVPKGSMVVLLTIACNRDKEIFGENVDEFVPERMSPENSKGLPINLAFGAGKRSCMGNNFSLLEMRIFLTMLLQRYKIFLPEGQEKLIIPAQSITLSPDKSSQIYLEPRK